MYLKIKKDKTKQKLLGREREMKKFLGRKQRRKEDTASYHILVSEAVFTWDHFYQIIV